MKYIFIIIALMCCSISGKAQTDSTETKKPKYSVREEKGSSVNMWNPKKTKAKIYSDKVNSDGFRHILGTERATSVENNTHYLLVSLGAYDTGNEHKFYLHWRYWWSVEPSFKEGSPVLLKLGDNSRIELKINNFYVPLPIVTVVYYSTIKTYTAYFWTEIAEEDIEKLAKGLTKIRVEINNAPFDVVLNKDNISQFLLEEYNLIKEQLKEKKTFYDDF